MSRESIVDGGRYKKTGNLHQLKNIKQNTNTVATQAHILWLSCLHHDTSCFEPLRSGFTRVQLPVKVKL